MAEVRYTLEYRRHGLTRLAAPSDRRPLFRWQASSLKDAKEAIEGS